MHACEPIPVLAEPGVAVGRRLRQQGERGAAIGTDERRRSRGSQRLLAEQREGEFVARIEQRDGILALAGALGNSPHLFGIGAVVHRNRLAPPRRLGESLIAIEPRGGETA